MLLHMTIFIEFLFFFPGSILENSAMELSIVLEWAVECCSSRLPVLLCAEGPWSPALHLSWVYTLEQCTGN